MRRVSASITDTPVSAALGLQPPLIDQRSDQLMMIKHQLVCFGLFIWSGVSAGDESVAGERRALGTGADICRCLRPGKGSR